MHNLDIFCRFTACLWNSLKDNLKYQRESGEKRRLVLLCSPCVCIHLSAVRSGSFWAEIDGKKKCKREEERSVL